MKSFEAALRADVRFFLDRVGYPSVPPSRQEAIALAKARHEIRMAAATAKAAPYVEAAEAKRQRRRERNLRVAGVR